MNAEIDETNRSGGRRLAPSAQTIMPRRRMLAEPETSYDDLVQVMDTVRSAIRPDPAGGVGRTVRAELFPNISIGDAPVRKQAGAPAPKGQS